MAKKSRAINRRRAPRPSLRKRAVHVKAIREIRDLVASESTSDRDTARALWRHMVSSERTGGPGRWLLLKRYCQLPDVRPELVAELKLVAGCSLRAKGGRK